MIQPVKKTLENINHIIVNDENYNKEIFQEKIKPEKRKDIMVLFYSDIERKIEGDESFSRANAALTRAINHFYPSIKIAIYKIGENEIIEKEVFLKLKKEYNLIDAPALLFYKKNNNKDIEYIKELELMGGINNIYYLKQMIDYYKKKIPLYINVK
jgi:hypothetical protein